MSWLAPLFWFGGGSGVVMITSELWSRFHDYRERKSIARKRQSWATEDVVDYCFGCDQIRPRSEMAFVDEDGDGTPDALYRCRVCRGLDTFVEREVVETEVPWTPEESQAATDERIDAWFGSSDYANNRGDDVIPWTPMTEEQIENVRQSTSAMVNAVNIYRAAGIDVTVASNAAYEAGLAARAERRRRQAVRNKLKMDDGSWRNHARRPQHH